MTNKIKQGIAEITPAGSGAAKNSGLRPEAVLVRDKLIELGLETPMIDNGLSPDEKKARIQAALRRDHGSARPRPDVTTAWSIRRNVSPRCMCRKSSAASITRISPS